MPISARQGAPVLTKSAAIAGAVAGAGALTDITQVGNVGAAAVARSSNVTLSMWTWKVFHVPAWQAVAKAFKAQTGIAVTVEAFQPDALYRTKLAASAGEPKSNRHTSIMLLSC